MKHFFNAQNEDLQYKYPWHPAKREYYLIPSFQQNPYDQEEIYAFVIEQGRVFMRGWYLSLRLTTFKCCLDWLKLWKWLVCNLCASSPPWSRQKDVEQKDIQLVPPSAAVRPQQLLH